MEKVLSLEQLVEFMDWFATLDIAFYKTEKFADYTPSGASHFYLKGSQERFTSEEIIDIWMNEENAATHANWLYAISEHASYCKKHSNIA